MSQSFNRHPEYREKYLRLLCEQNRKLFTSPHYWFFEHDDLPLNPRALLSDSSRTFLEIGFGHGEVLEELVQRYPETGFVGIERRPGRVRKALKRLQRVQRTNVRLFRANLELIEAALFTRGAFDEILINHPDPWPKRRHQHHRFFQKKTLDDFADWLAPGGIIEVCSDRTDYFFYILHLFETDARFSSQMPPPFFMDQPIPGRPVSRFERMKRAAGITVRLLRYSRM